MVVGNFHIHNPDRAWMEWCGESFLIHRMEADLLHLCDRAGIPREHLTFSLEPLGAVVFLVATRPNTVFCFLFKKMPNINKLSSEFVALE